jgi:hypothetical protein
MAADEKWYFTKEQLANTPSRKCGYELDKELSYRQQAANFIQDMGQRLQVYPFPPKNVMLVIEVCLKIISTFCCEKCTLLNFRTCYEALGDRKLVGVCVCCVYRTSASKEMSHTWQDVPCSLRHAILIM